MRRVRRPRASRALHPGNWAAGRCWQLTAGNRRAPGGQQRHSGAEAPSGRCEKETPCPQRRAPRRVWAAEAGAAWRPGQAWPPRGRRAPGARAWAGVAAGPAGRGPLRRCAPAWVRRGALGHSYNLHGALSKQKLRSAAVPARWPAPAPAGNKAPRSAGEGGRLPAQQPAAEQSGAGQAGGQSVPSAHSVRSARTRMSSFSERTQHRKLSARTRSRAGSMA